MASGPLSPVRMRIVSSAGKTKILPSSNLARRGRLLHRFYHVIDVFSATTISISTWARIQLCIHFRDKALYVLGSFQNPDLTDGHPVNPNAVESFFDFIKLERADYTFQFFSWVNLPFYLSTIYEVYDPP